MTKFVLSAKLIKFENKVRVHILCIMILTCHLLDASVEAYHIVFRNLDQAISNRLQQLLYLDNNFQAYTDRVLSSI